MAKVEVIARVERRRQWTEAEKATLVAETDRPGSSVRKIAREHGVAASLLYNWRAARRAQVAATMPGAAGLEFIPLGTIGPPATSDSLANPSSAAAPVRTAPRRSDETEGCGTIEIELPNGARILVAEAASEKALRRVLQAMKDLW